MKKYGRIKMVVFVNVFLTIIVLAVICILYEKYILPPALRVSQSYAITYVNRQINEVVENVIDRNNFGFDSFCTTTTNQDGQITAITTNGMAVNRFCSQVAQELSQQLNYYNDNKIYIKSGTMSGISLLVGMGFDIPVSVSCIGETLADYEVQTESVGINQVSYKLYINVNSCVRAYNPLINNEITVKRKLLLSNVVYGGKVPDGMLLPVK